MKRSDVIDNSNIKPGNVIVGLSSFGQASYEKEYNGGMGSNGLTSARHDVFSKLLAEKYPESFDNSIPEELIYSGTKNLTDAVENSPLDAGKLVLITNQDLCAGDQKNTFQIQQQRDQRNGALQRGSANQDPSFC
jgi:phosphoribosylformylglycinamidine cyclo-ligase